MGKMMTNFGTLEDVQTRLDLTTAKPQLCIAERKKCVFLLAKNTTGLPIGYLKSHPETRAEILPAGSLRALAASSVPAPLQRAPSAPPSQHLPSEAAQGPTGTEMMKLGALLARVSLQARKDPKALCISTLYLFSKPFWANNQAIAKSARTEGAEAFFVCLREPLAIAL